MLPTYFDIMTARELLINIYTKGIDVGLHPKVGLSIDDVDDAITQLRALVDEVINQNNKELQRQRADELFGSREASGEADTK